MEWSPSRCPGSDQWSPQWICVRCTRSVGLSDIPTRPVSQCPRCNDSNLSLVLDCHSHERWMWCARCQVRGAEVPGALTVPVPQVDVRLSGWFSQGPLSEMGPLYGWGESPITPPGSGPQSWLFCPLISLALESVEVACGVAPWSTGSRHPVPDRQRHFWRSTAMEIIQMFGTFVQSLSPESEAAQGLQHNWDGGEHLPARLQELCSPPHIMSALCVWIARQCDEFVSPTPTSGNVVVQRVPSPVSPPPAPHPVPRPSRSAPNPFSAATPPPDPSDPVNPFSVIAPPPGPLEPANPFSAAAPTVPQVPREAIVASNPFVALPPERSAAPSIHPCPSGGPSSAAPLSRPCPGGGGPFPDAGPARLTRFLEMSLDNYYATVSEMVSLGRFEHIGHATVRVEGASAWGVWLRVDHWPTSLGRHPRLRCGVLYHVANRTLSFHGVADAVQFLLPLFESWTYSSLPQLPSIRADRVSPVVPLDDPRVPDSRVPGGGPSSPVAPYEISSLRSLVHQLVDLCHGNQREIVRLRDEVSQLRSQLACRPQPSPPTQHEPQQVCPPPPPLAPVGDGDSRLVCRRAGCSNEVASSCPVRFCQAHCTSPRCNAHGSPVTSQVRQCRMRGCRSSVPRSCASGFCALHCTSSRCSLHRRRQPVCSSPNCSSSPSPSSCGWCLLGALLSPSVFSSPTSPESSCNSPIPISEDLQSANLQ